MPQPDLFAFADAEAHRPGPLVEAPPQDAPKKRQPSRERRIVSRIVASPPSCAGETLAAPKLMSVTRALKRYSIGRTKLYELIGDGHIKAVKLGAKTLIDVALTDAYFDTLPQSNSTCVA
jgi:excisionase family DNA binding protein